MECNDGVNFPEVPLALVVVMMAHFFAAVTLIESSSLSLRVGTLRQGLCMLHLLRHTDSKALPTCFVLCDNFDSQYVIILCSGLDMSSHCYYGGMHGSQSVQKQGRVWKIQCAGRGVGRVRWHMPPS
jgi:hypothetical protein